MNPNNDAYWADQENRFGGQDDDDGWVDDGNSYGGERQPRDPHADLRRKLELAYATPESEERDNREARAEFLRWAEEVVTIAAEVATKQLFGGHVINGDGFVELVLGDGRCVRVSDVPEHALISVGNRLFGYSKKKWRSAHEKSARWQEPVTYEFDNIVDADPHKELLHALEHPGFEPTLSKLRAEVERARQVNGSGALDRGRWEKARKVQEKIAEIKAKLPPGFENDSWEDTWTPPDG